MFPTLPYVKMRLGDVSYHPPPTRPVFYCYICIHVTCCCCGFVSSLIGNIFEGTNRAFRASERVCGRFKVIRLRRITPPHTQQPTGGELNRICSGQNMSAPPQRMKLLSDSREWDDTRYHTPPEIAYRE